MLTDFKDDVDVPRERAAVIVPIRQILERLEKAANDNWPATAEKRMPTVERQDIAKVIAKFDSFDAVTERAAISVMKLAGWVATIAVVLDGLWKSL